MNSHIPARAPARVTGSTVRSPGDHQDRLYGVRTAPSGAGRHGVIPARGGPALVPARVTNRRSVHRATTRVAPTAQRHRVPGGFVAWSSACVGAGLVPARATIRRSVTRVAAPRVTVRVSPEPGVGRQIPVDELPADPLNSLKMEGDLPISAELLEILACPSCKAEVVLTADRTGLECTSCHLVYPIRDGIPVMLIDEAIKPPDEGGESSA